MRRAATIALVLLLIGTALAEGYEFEYADDYEENSEYYDDYYDEYDAKYQALLDPMNEDTTDPSLDLTTDELEDGTLEITGWDSTAPKIEIPTELAGKKVTRIADGAFTYKLTLRAVIIPEGITEIGENAFFGCIALQTVQLPNSVTKVGANPFMGCWKLTDIIISEDHPCLVFDDGKLYSKTDGKLIYCSPIIQGASSSFPDNIPTICAQAYAGCNTLTSLWFLNNVNAIEREAFLDCGALENVKFPESITNIEGNPFVRCYALQEFEVMPDHPYLATIDGVLFSKPDRRVICYPCAFESKEYSIPGGIQTIGVEAFAYCDRLEHIEIPDSVKAIEEAAFLSCDGITSITVPDGVITIGDNAFRYCTALSTVELPSSVTAIGEQAFANCGEIMFTVPRDSYTAAYCRENKLMYTYPDANDWLLN